MLRQSVAALVAVCCTVMWGGGYGPCAPPVVTALHRAAGGRLVLESSLRAESGCPRVHAVDLVGTEFLWEDAPCHPAARYDSGEHGGVCAPPLECVSRRQPGETQRFFCKPPLRQHGELCTRAADCPAASPGCGGWTANKTFLPSEEYVAYFCRPGSPWRRANAGKVPQRLTSMSSAHEEKATEMCVAKASAELECALVDCRAPPAEAPPAGDTAPPQ